MAAGQVRPQALVIVWYPPSVSVLVVVFDLGARECVSVIVYVVSVVSVVCVFACVVCLWCMSVAFGSRFAFSDFPPTLTWKSQLQRSWGLWGGNGLRT